MSTTTNPTEEMKGKSAARMGRSSAIQSILLFFCVLFSLRFMLLLLHEGGHALAEVLQGHHLTLLYAHPFFFSGYARATIEGDQVLNHAAGPALAALVSLVIFIPLWRRRKAALLPLLMVFPWVAMETGTNVAPLAGDYRNIIRLTGVPEAVITIPSLVLLVLGIILFLSLMPLLGLGPSDWRVLFVLPAAIILWSAVSILVAHLVVPGSPIDVIYHEGTDVIRTAEGVWPRGVVLVLFIAVIYLTLYRLIYPRLPSSWKSETSVLTWKDLRMPALAAAAWVIVGLILIH